MEGGNDIEIWNIKRRSKDKVLNARGRAMIDLVADCRIFIFFNFILNDTTRKDVEGEFTYIEPRGRDL